MMGPWLRTTLPCPASETAATPPGVVLGVHAGAVPVGPVGTRHALVKAATAYIAPNDRTISVASCAG